MSEHHDKLKGWTPTKEFKNYLKYCEWFKKNETRVPLTFERWLEAGNVNRG